MSVALNCCDEMVFTGMSRVLSTALVQHNRDPTIFWMRRMPVASKAGEVSGARA